MNAGADGPGEAQRAAMARDGFLLMPAFFAAAEVDVMRRWIEELAAAPQAPGRHWVYHEAVAAAPDAGV